MCSFISSAWRGAARVVQGAADHPVPIVGIAGAEAFDLMVAGMQIQHVLHEVVAFGSGVGASDDGIAVAFVCGQMVCYSFQ